MKTTIIAVVSLLAGIGVGWYGGSRPNGKISRDNQDAQRTLNNIGNVEERCSAEAASISAFAVQAIDSGETQKAVQYLSFPISHYYFLYGSRDEAGTNAQRLKLGARIEQLASTNHVVDARIKDLEGAAKILERGDKKKGL